MSAQLDTVRAIVAAVRDPELPSLTIDDLGILRDVRIEGETVIVAITPTYSGCPALGVIAEDIVAALRSHALESRVETVLSPAWTTDWMSDEAKQRLLSEGVAPPGATSCPQCGSEEIEPISEYGATACQALYTCRACAEPFPYFKVHR